MNETRGFSEDSGSENHHLSMLVPTGLAIDNQPPVVSVDV